MAPAMRAPKAISAPDSTNRMSLSITVTSLFFQNGISLWRVGKEPDMKTNSTIIGVNNSNNKSAQITIFKVVA